MHAAATGQTAMSCNDLTTMPSITSSQAATAPPAAASARRSHPVPATRIGKMVPVKVVGSGDVDWRKDMLEIHKAKTASQKMKRSPQGGGCVQPLEVDEFEVREHMYEYI